MPAVSFTGVVLAGGQSRRMGQDKATLLVAGEPLLYRQLRVLRAAGAAELLVSMSADGVTGLALDPDVDVVFDRLAGAGPLAGLENAFRTARWPLVMVLAVDLPAMSPVFLRQLIETATAECGIVPVLDDRFEPLAAVYPPPAHVEVAARLARGELALQPFVQAGLDAGWLRTLNVTASDAGCFTNWNSPGDYSPAARAV